MIISIYAKKHETPYALVFKVSFEEDTPMYELDKFLKDIGDSLQFPTNGYADFEKPSLQAQITLESGRTITTNLR
jgi:hypothetical protein